MSTRDLSPGEKLSSHFFEERLGETQLKIYPNPVKSVLTVEIAGFDTGQYGECRLFGSSGTLLNRTQITEENTSIDISGFPQGNYVLQIIINEEKTSWKIIKE
jgi:hypothetical protein